MTNPGFTHAYVITDVLGRQHVAPVYPASTFSSLPTLVTARVMGAPAVRTHTAWLLIPAIASIDGECRSVAEQLAAVGADTARCWLAVGHHVNPHVSCVLR